MPRKKVSTDADVIEGIAEINDDEQLVEETTRKVRRERVSRTKPEPEPETIIDFDDEDEDDEPPNTPLYSDTSLAAAIFDDDADTFHRPQYCNVNIRRNPDSMNDRFSTPCRNVLSLPPLRNVEITADKSDIEEQVRSEYGGGHYFFQINYDGKLRHSWKTSLADLPANQRPNPNAAEPTPAAPTPPPVPPPADPLDSMINSLAKMRTLKEALFGDEEARMQRRIEELERQIETRPEPAAAQPLPENLQILEKALATTNPTLQTKLLDYAFPPDSGSHWIPETIKTIFEHKDEIGGLLSVLIGGLAPQQPRPQQPQTIDNLLRGQPPVALQPQTFRRSVPPRADDGNNTDAANTNAETIIEDTPENETADS